jgi:hypothetical protein
MLPEVLRGLHTARSFPPPRAQGRAGLCAIRSASFVDPVRDLQGDRPAASQPFRYSDREFLFGVGGNPLL